MGKSILVVDDEATLCEALRFNLEMEGYDVAVAHSAAEALTLPIGNFDLILLDVMMDGLDGYDLARILRSNATTANVPIIFCTAKGAEDDIVKGLTLGADDYITKPFSLRVLMARVKKTLERHKATAADPSDKADTLQFEGLVLDDNLKEVSVDGEVAKMPRKEYELLALLISNRDRVFSRDEILTRVWPENTVVVYRVVDVTIRRIRAKIGKYAAHIITRSGYGYGFKE